MVRLIIVLGLERSTCREIGGLGRDKGYCPDSHNYVSRSVQLVTESTGSGDATHAMLLLGLVGWPRKLVSGREKEGYSECMGGTGSEGVGTDQLFGIS